MATRGRLVVGIKQRKVLLSRLLPTLPVCQAKARAALTSWRFPGFDN